MVDREGGFERGGRGEERRISPRVALDFKLKYYIDENAYIEFPTRDISTGGLSFVTDKLYDAGMEIDISIYVDGMPDAIRASGRVVRVWDEDEHFYAAAQITGIDGGDQNILNEMIWNYLESLEADKV